MTLTKRPVITVFLVLLSIGFAFRTSSVLAGGQKTLYISSTSGGSVTYPGEGAFQYDDGSAATITAIADLNYHFVGWAGSAVDAGKVADPNSASTTVTVDADYDLQAHFAVSDPIFFVSPTPDDGEAITDSAVDINIMIVEPNLTNVTFDWNGSPAVQEDRQVSSVVPLALDRHTCTCQAATGLPRSDEIRCKCASKRADIWDRSSGVPVPCPHASGCEKESAASGCRIGRLPPCSPSPSHTAETTLHSSGDRQRGSFLCPTDPTEEQAQTSYSRYLPCSERTHLC